MTYQGIFIDGRWIETPTSRAVIDAWTGVELARLAVASREDAVAATDAAVHAMRNPLAIPERSRVLSAVARAMEERAEELAELITAELGKPLTASRAEVSRGVLTTQLAAEEAKRLPGEYVPLDAAAAGADTGPRLSPGPSTHPPRDGSPPVSIARPWLAPGPFP